MRHDVSALRIDASGPGGSRVDVLSVGSSLQLKLFAVTGNGGTDLVMGNVAAWTSSNVKVAEINRQGRLTARSPGTVTITATHAGQTAHATLEVVAAPPTR
jgi:uncharacterized protein YjdB